MTRRETYPDLPGPEQPSRVLWFLAGAASASLLALGAVAHAVRAAGEPPATEAAPARVTRQLEVTILDARERARGDPLRGRGPSWVPPRTKVVCYERSAP